MIKILIIDDESAIRNTLIKLINCFHEEYELVGEAVNGFQGLTLIKEKKPDIIILDIKMPEMDGLTLLEKLRRQDINCKVIILSAYNDFSYAKDALKLSALDYLLKPVKREDLRKVLNKAVLIIKKENEDYEREISMKNLLDKSAVAYEDAILNLLIDGDNYDKLVNDIPSVLKKKIKYVAAMVFNLSGDPAAKNIRLKELKHMMETDLSSYIKGYSLFDKDKNLVFLDILEDDVNKDTLASVFNEHAKIFQYAFYSTTGYKVPVGIGQAYETLNSVYKSYSEACIALEHRFVSVDSSIICYTDCNYPDTEFRYPSKTENLILNSLLLGDGDSIIINLNQFFNEITKVKLNPASLKQICMQLGIIILKKVKELNIINHLSGIEDSYFFDMSRYETVSDYKNQLILVAYKIINYINESKKSQNEFKLKKMVDKYLESNFTRNIGLLDVAKELGVTSNYFSSLFKREVGKNFVEYLTHYRMQIAKKLLLEEKYHIARIAAMVGYSDVKYFFRVFRKFEGVTPKEYKQVLKASADDR